MARTTRSNLASRIAAVAEATGLDAERVGVIASEAGAKSATAIRAAVDAWREVHHDDGTPREPVVEEKAPRVKKASLTLSQRRALLKLRGEPQTPATAFKALPYEYLASVGLAVKGDDGAYELTDAGFARADEINPGYLVWSAGESVCGDESRPEAGTARAAKAAAKDETTTEEVVAS